MKAQTIFRTKLSTGFTTLPNKFLRDKRLSFKARGVLAMVLTNTKDWGVKCGWLESQSPSEGREAIRGALNELKAFGYTTFHRENIDGKLHSVWHFFDTDGNAQPVDGKGLSGVQSDGGQSDGKPSDGEPFNGKPSEKEERTRNKEEPRKEEESKDKEKALRANAVSIYEAYPCKVARKKAIESIEKAIRQGANPEVLLDKTTAFAALWNGDLTYCPNPTTWFNQERFNDDPSTWRRANGVKPKADHSKGF